MLNEVYLGLGSNLGDREDNILSGLELLQERVQHMVVSSMYETAPQGFRHQPAFMNAACQIWTRLDPFQLMDVVKRIEVEVGRHRVFINAPRTLDIDILTFGQMVLDSPILTLPHPRMAERGFVLEPLAEIAPTLHHPVLKESISALLARLNAPRNQNRLRAPVNEGVIG